MSITIPEAFQFLFEPSRYKVLHGGRGSGKSTNVARALLIQAVQEPLRILCARELQSSIRDSVHKLLADEIVAMGMQDFYEIQTNGIFGKNGSEMLFKGLRHSISEVKSIQGIDRAWVEEAAIVSKASWETLIPTIRKEKSEIWVTYNPMLEEDDTHQRFVINTPPPGSIVRQVNWDSNPFFPEVLRIEMEHMKANDPDGYLNIWLGNCRHSLDGAIFSNELRESEAGGRICRVPFVQGKPVEVFCDLGRRDMTSIWMAQIINMEYRILDFYEGSGHHWSHYLKVLQQKPYTYSSLWLPHDASHDLLASERTIVQQSRAAGFNTKSIPNIKKGNQIEAARSLFGQCWFDLEKTAAGIKHLRQYQYGEDPNTKIRSREPLHNEHSHAADAFLYLAVALRPQKPKSSIGAFKANPGASKSWLAR
jgi:phage terminase large subunit